MYDQRNLNLHSDQGRTYKQQKQTQIYIEQILCDSYLPVQFSIDRHYKDNLDELEDQTLLSLLDFAPQQLQYNAIVKELESRSWEQTEDDGTWENPKKGLTWQLGVMSQKQ